MKKDIERKREQEKEMVSWMILHHPVAVMRHVIESKKEKKKLKVV